MSIKMRTYFSILCAVLVILLTAVLTVSIGRKSSETLEAEIGNSLAATAYQMADKLDHYMWSRSAEIKVLSSLETFRQGETESIQALLNQLKRDVPSFSWVGFTDSQGTVQAATHGILVGKSIANRPVYKNALEKTFAGDVHDAVLLAKLLPNPGGEPLQFVDISTPVKTGDGRFVGVLAAHLSWEWSKTIENALRASLQRSKKDVDILIVSSMNNTVLLGPKSVVGKPLNLDSLDKAMDKKNNWTVEKWPDGKSYLTGYAFGDGYENYPGLGWSVLVRQDASTAYLSVKELQQFIVWLGAISAIVFAIIGWFVADKIVSPLNKISSAANEARCGGKVKIPGYKGIKEIEILSDSLKELLDNLQKTESRLGRMEDLAHQDKLTGMANRLALDELLKSIQKNKDKQLQPYIFLYLDLDGFKTVNDRFGHHSGDLILQETAARFASKMFAGTFIARLGGDEFLVVIPAADKDYYTKGEFVANEIIKAINWPFRIENKQVKIGCSIGGAIWPLDHEDPQMVIQLADHALYESKKNGKNQITFIQSNRIIENI
ncbi:diguanylate cyclase domain-containing protein [Peribacillus sp. SCS-155]|uniref:sensor domain-containing diguanylate cyclase n=1 Tax=Peribacillus sedimenti TaxID=3115297 RepID=UPI003905CFB7